MRSMTTVLGVLVAAMGLATGLASVTGCGGSASHGPAMSPPGYGGNADAAQAKGSYEAPATSAPAGYPSQPSMSGPMGGATAEASTPPPAPPSSYEQPAPRPQDRPGLGTEWGETRESRITEVSFLRDEPSHPFAQVALWYNDWQGMQNLAAFHGGPRFHDYQAEGGAITVSIRGADGSPLDAMSVGDRTYVIGQEGERYSIVVRNHTRRSFEAVATVDGLDVMNGQPGSYDNRGYVLGPYGSLEIDGFRQSEDAVAAFRFSKVKDSYAAQTGSARNVGVIGVAFFAQQGDDWDRADLRMRDTASPFPNEGRFAQPPRR
jgi:hypothetical protein